jgi:two-component system, cell cycle sensor histidine kinase and response regulator CckA
VSPTKGSDEPTSPAPQVHPSLDAAIRRLVRGGAAFVGNDFFGAIVADLSEVLGAEFVFVGRLTDDGSSVETVALWGGGQLQDNMTYALLHTPCANVVGREVCCHPRQVALEFPDDELLIEMGIEGYVGVPLFAGDGSALGIMVALYQAPVADPEFVSTLMQFFSTRTGAEMERVLREEARRRLEGKLLQSQKLESLGVLAGGLAHDFNNLLAAILGSVDLAALELPVSHSVREHLQLIGKTSEQAGELCRQLLAYAGKGRFELSDVDLSSVVSEVEQLLRASISKSAALELDLAAGLPAVRVDLAQVRQVLLNLVINASEAIGEATGTIRIVTGRVQVDESYLAAEHLQCAAGVGDYVYLEVSDTGGGMSHEEIEKIFDPFYTTKFTGRGLGLAAVLGIVKGHQGIIKIYSESQQGTSFKVMFPEAESPVETEVEQPSEQWRGDGLALLIDDDPNVRGVGSRLLEALGFEALTAEDGAVGVRTFQEHADRVRVVLLDLTMPNMGGEEAFRELRKIRSDLPIILMSGFNQQDSISRFVGEGLAGFLQKPFRLRDVANKIQAALEA